MSIKQALRIGAGLGKGIVAVMGGLLILLGIPLLVLPGPGVLVILLGLGILSIAFHWPRVAFRRLWQLLRSRLWADSRAGGGGSPANQQLKLSRRSGKQLTK